MKNLFPFRKAMVTGGAGFIGSHIVQELLMLGIETTSVDNYSAGKRENLKGFENHHLLNEVNCDVTDVENLRKYMNGVDIIFHNAASKKNVCLNNPRLDLRINAEGTFNILELALEYKVKKIVHASTGSVYGEALYHPQDEEHPLNPVSYYGVSKLAGERYVMTFAHLYGLNISVLRYFHVYGPRQESADDRGGVVGIFSKRAVGGQNLIIYGDGTQQRSFTFVKDIVKANLIVASDEKAKGRIFNCASGLKITINELADKIIKFSGKPIVKEYQNWLPGDIKIFDVSNLKIKELGLHDWINFDKGLEDTYNWYKNNFPR